MQVCGVISVVETIIICVAVAVSSITFDGQKSSGMIKGVAFGTLAPGVNVTKTLLLSIEGATGDRTIDISVQSRTSSSPLPPMSPASPGSPSHSADTTEALRTLVIPTLEPIKVEQTVKYKRSTKPLAGLGDLDTFEDEYWDDAGEAHVATTMTCAGQSGISVESVKLVREVRFRRYSYIPRIRSQLVSRMDVGQRSPTLS